MGVAQVRTGPGGKLWVKVLTSLQEREERKGVHVSACVVPAYTQIENIISRSGAFTSYKYFCALSS